VSRIKRIEPENFDPELQQMMDVERRTPLEIGNVRYYAHRPELAKALLQFMGVLRAPGLLSARLIELVRLRVAFHNQCRSCMAIRYDVAVQDGVTEELVCQLERPQEAAGLTDAERVAVRYADLFATSHLAIDDALIEELRSHFTEPEIVELGLNVAIFVGLGRFSAVCDMIEELPERFQDRAEPVVPWGPDAILVERLDRTAAIA
jgi:AhpD family alkylhydroperoxidase